MTHRFARLRRFRFNLPQRIAAGLLALFLTQGLWITATRRSPIAITNTPAADGKCGRSRRPSPDTSPLAAISTTASLPTALAGLPLTLNLLAQRGLDLFRKPEDRVIQPV